MRRRVASWSARVIAAAILLQTLFFKFSDAPQSVYIFTAVGQEPWGRYGSGIVELIASVLLFVPRGVAVGALLAAGTMCGATFFHLTKLGIVVHYVTGATIYVDGGMTLYPGFETGG